LVVLKILLSLHHNNKQIEIMTATIETLRTENKQLLTLSEQLLKQVNKMIKKDVNGAKLLFSRVQEINNKRQDNNSLILSLS
jgi:uncharacterized protein YoxC